MKRHFAEEDIRTATEHIKKMFHIMNHYGKEIKTTMGYSFTPMRTDKINRACWCGCRESELHTHRWSTYEMIHPL